MEGHTHHATAVLAEGVLRRKPRQLVHQHRLHKTTDATAAAEGCMSVQTALERGCNCWQRQCRESWVLYVLPQGPLTERVHCCQHGQATTPDV